MKTTESTAPAAGAPEPSFREKLQAEAQGFAQLHFEVEDVAQKVSEATQLGAGVLVPPQTLPNGEKMAVLRDPDGIPFVLRSRPRA